MKHKIIWLENASLVNPSASSLESGARPSQDQPRERPLSGSWFPSLVFHDLAQSDAVSSILPDCSCFKFRFLSTTSVVVIWVISVPNC